jgi:hypothetical protein
MDITIIYSAFNLGVDEINAQRPTGSRQVVKDATAHVVGIPECFEAEDNVILEALFENTNLYHGPFWDRLRLPENRTHTAISVGDRVLIDGREYECAAIGWDRIDEYDVPDPIDDVPWWTPSEWIPDNPDENGMRDSDFV